MPLPTPETTVWASVTAPGFHHWPDATPHRAYLADHHRHLFHLHARVRVTHEDRQVEFHDLSDTLRTWWGPHPRDCGTASCETLARALAAHLDQLGMSVHTVTVSEDGEHGATLTYPTPEGTPA